MHRLAFLIALLLPALCFGAEQDNISYAGTWKGTIGKGKVQVCFNTLDSQYYYLRHKTGIVLARNESNHDEWNEEVKNPQSYDRDVTGIWKLSRIETGEIQGIWVNPKTKEELPIKLSRVASIDRSYGCGDAFYAPITDSIKYQYGTGSDGLKTIKTDAAEAFEMPAASKNASKINSFIHTWIKQQAVESYGCEIGGGGGWDKTLSLVFRSDDWLVMRDSMPDTFCGGAHPDWSIEHHTFDLNTGEFIDVWSWLKGGQKIMQPVRNGAKKKSKKAEGETSDVSMDDAHRDEGKSKFWQLIEKLNPRTDCGAPMYLGQPYPRATGLVFPTGYSHAERACEDEIEISYKDLKPFLSPSGKKAVESITRH